MENKKQLRVLVCGSRHYNDYESATRVLDSLPGEISEIISGGARGADSLGERYAAAHSIPCIRFPALWELHGKRAGPIRNGQMLKEGTPDLVVAFLAPDSRGTANMIAQAERAGVKTLIINI